MTDTGARGPLVFQIGFNRSATGALFKLFQKSGVKSLHYMGRMHRKAGDFTLLNRNPQKVIDRNLRSGRPPVEGLEEFRAFFDMEFTEGPRRIENYRDFDRFAEAYPEALFIMNYRRKADWLKSRIAHNKGRYLKKHCEFVGTDATGVVRHWSEHYDEHIAQVEAYFGRDGDRCVWFDIDADPIEKIVDFFRPHYTLNLKRWKRVHATDWDNTIGAYAQSLQERAVPLPPAEAPAPRPEATGRRIA